MTTGVVTTKLRPVRLAFLVEPTLSVVRQAIGLSSLLWGGCFNPIVPVYRKVPPKWVAHPFRVPTPGVVVSGFLNSFEPDFVVTLGNVGDLSAIDVDIGRIHLRSQDVHGQFAARGYPGVGVGLIELGLDLIEEEFKYVRRKPLELAFPKSRGAADTFLAAVFGLLNSEDERVVKERLSHEIEISEPAIHLTDYHQLLEPRFQFPRRIGMRRLQYYPSRAVVFIMNPMSCFDVMDFWNLRAAGYRVMPMPVALMEQEWARRAIADFIESEYRPNAIGEWTLLLVSRSLRERVDDVRQYGRALEIQDTEQNGNHRPKWMASSHFPRLWDQWAQEETNETVQHFFSLDRVTPVEGTSLELDPIKPSFQIGGPSFFARFANVFEYQVDDSQEPIAEILPSNAALSDIGIPARLAGEIRSSKSGIVMLCDQETLRRRIEVPSAREVFIRWLDSKGWTAKLSPAGSIAEAMLRLLGGVDSVQRLAQAQLLNLLERYTSERAGADEDARGPARPKGIPYNEWERVSGALFNPSPEALARAETNEARQRLRNRGEAAKSELFRFLLDHNVLKLGADFHCPTCQRYIWRRVDQLDYTLQCEYCQAVVPVEARHISRPGTWTYKPHGPFAIQGFGEGAYSVLLTLSFIRRLRGMRMTPAMSFKAKNADGLELEADVGVHFRESVFGDRWQSGLLFAECKSFHERSFKPIDIERMRELANAFPQSILVFACLKNRLSEYEVRLIRNFELSNRRRYLKRQPYSPVMVITGTELLGNRLVPRCWRGLGGQFEVWANYQIVGLSHLVSATQVLYLGLPQFGEWVNAEREKQRLKAVELAARRVQ